MAYFHTTVLDNQIKALPTVDTASGSIATFDTDMTENLVECECDILYQGTGGGTPQSPNPITVYSSLNLSHSGADTSNPTIINIPFGQTVAKGKLDVLSGVLTITHKAITLDGTQAVANRNWRPQANSVGWLYSSILTDVKRPIITELPDAKSDKLQTVTYNALFSNDIDSFGIVNSGAYTLAVRVRDTSLTTDTAINTWLAQNPITIMYEIDTPQVIQLNANQVTALLNENNIWCDTGDTEVKYLLTVGKAIS